jgi:hypothetical protein
MAAAPAGPAPKKTVGWAKAATAFRSVRSACPAFAHPTSLPCLQEARVARAKGAETPPLRPHIVHQYDDVRPDGVVQVPSGRTV